MSNIGGLKQSELFKWCAITLREAADGFSRFSEAARGALSGVELGKWKTPTSGQGAVSGTQTTVALTGDSADDSARSGVAGTMTSPREVVRSSCLSVNLRRSFRSFLSSK